MARIIKITFFSLIIALAGFSVWQIKNQTILSPSKDIELKSLLPTATPFLPRLTPVSEPPQIKGFSYLKFSASPQSKLILVANFEEKLLAGEICRINSCRTFVNGPFYDIGARPLGLFTVNGQKIRARENNRLIDAILWQEASGVFRLEFNDPADPVFWAVQTGPMLVYEHEPLEITIRNDEPARRTGAILTSTGELVFFVFYSKNQIYSGPLLSEIPELVIRLSHRENIDIASAVNLDGGSASAFFDGQTKLEELTFVGSLFCLQ